MQFVREGPEVPERLLQAHEDGNVVFFCGAGISYPAGLPDFGGLTRRLYDDLGASPDPVQRTALTEKRFDTAIGLLEAAIVGKRERVRRAVANILKPDFGRPDATLTHEALLVLATNGDGRVHLVTTNFDRVFEEAISRRHLTISTFAAPLLPVPKSMWDGLVYLHGLLTDPPTTGAFERLVISSGDFGLAYLTERWAARFVTELFSRYTVCFAGYSINDPVLRYMMDALAADRLRGERPPEMFAFASYAAGAESAQANEWKAKNVTPILYLEDRCHEAFHSTIQAWANTYRDGVRGKEQIVLSSASARPVASTAQDNFVDRMLWALSDPSGLPAKAFADLSPAPSLEWLEPLTQPRYSDPDLARFGVAPQHNPAKATAFSLLSRPAPYRLASPMTVCQQHWASQRWDEVMNHLARWLLRHLDNPQLLLWVAKQGGKLRWEFERLLHGELERLCRLERENKTKELEGIRQNAPHAIPGPAMRALWRLALTGRLASADRHFDLFLWTELAKDHGLTPSLRLSLRELLAPSVEVREPLRMGTAMASTPHAERVSDLVSWDITVSARDAHRQLAHLFDQPSWHGALPALVSDFTTVLRDTLELKQELGGAAPLSDHSYAAQPSISSHELNQPVRGWTVLIEILRDAWLALERVNAAEALRVVRGWWATPFPVFKRLVLFASSQEAAVEAREALDYLLADDRHWLWSIETQREVLRLLVVLGPRLDPAGRTALETAILAGPPRAMFQAGIETERWEFHRDRMVWLRLAKAESSGTQWSAAAHEHAKTLAAARSWVVRQDDEDEFPFFVKAGWVGDGSMGAELVLPRDHDSLVGFLRTHPAPEFIQPDDWPRLCREDFLLAAAALRSLARQGSWPAQRLSAALQVWSEAVLHQASWDEIGPLLADAGDGDLREVLHSVAWWLQAIAKTFYGRDEAYVDLCWRVLSLNPPQAPDADEPVFKAVNEAGGQVTEALIRWWYRQSLEDNQGLTPELSRILTALCDASKTEFRYCRVLLGAHLLPLFRVDRTWAISRLLPFFGWEHASGEAYAVWQGFLWSPRLYPALLDAIKAPFLKTAAHYEQLGKYGEQYATLLTFVALESESQLTTSEVALALDALPDAGRRSAAEALVRALEGAQEKRTEFWRNRVVPFIQKSWPKSAETVTPALAEVFARVCLAADDLLPEAIELFRDWLGPVADPLHLACELLESGLCQRAPRAVLQLINIVVRDEPGWAAPKLRECLDAIREAGPTISPSEYERLENALRKRGA